MLRTLFAFLTLAAGPALLAQGTPAPAPKLAGVTAHVYKQTPTRPLLLYSLKPPATFAGPRPAIVFFFGGGWVAGNPAQFKPQSEYLASRGIVGIRVEYRLIPKGDRGAPVVCVQDAKSAMRYVRSHAKELGVDPHRIAAAGGSAGGHLAAATALLPGLDDPSDDRSISPRPDALILFNPVFNNGPGQWGHQRVGDRFKEFSPAHNVTDKAPPAIVFLGDSDKLIPVQVVKDFQADMKKAGVRCDVHIYPGAGHGFFNKKPNNDPKWFKDTLTEADRFLTSLGWLKGEPTLK